MPDIVRKQSAHLEGICGMKLSANKLFHLTDHFAPFAQGLAVAGRTQSRRHLSIHRMDPNLVCRTGLSLPPGLGIPLRKTTRDKKWGLTWRMCREQHTPRRVIGIMGWPASEAAASQCVMSSCTLAWMPCTGPRSSASALCKHGALQLCSRMRSDGGMAKVLELGCTLKCCAILRKPQNPFSLDAWHHLHLGKMGTNCPRW